MRPDRIQRRARDERVAAHAGFWWGLAEGTFFFIVPDVYISFAALFAVRAGAVAWLFSIAGSLAAVLIIFLLMISLRADYPGFLQQVPGISGALIARVHASLETSGLPYSPFLAAGGVPLKVYAATAFSQGISLGSVLLWTMFARIVRIAPTFAVVAIIRVLFGGSIDRGPGRWLAVLVVFWAVFYVFYFTRMQS